MKTRFFLALLIVLVAAFGVVLAQDLNPCFSLSEADCAAVGEATANTATYLDGVSSFTVDVDVSVAADNIPDEAMPSFSYEQTGSIDFIVNPDAQTGLNAYGYFDIAANDGNEDQEISIEFWLVDDVVYFINPEDEGLYSIDLVRVIEETDIQASIEDAATDPSSVLGDSLMTDSSLETIGALITLPGLLDWTREGDDFVFTVDFAALTNPDNQEVLEGIVETVSEADPSTGAQLEAYLPMISQMLQSGTVTFTQGLNTDLNIIDTYSLGANFEIATGMMMGDPSLPATTFDMLATISFGNFDGAENPEAPADAEDITDAVIEGLGGALSGMGQQ